MMLRVPLIAVFFLTVTPLLVALQWVLDKLNLPGWGFICCRYYRVLAFLLRINVRVEGVPAAGEQAILFLSNHVSWTDIVVIGSIVPVAFIAKREVETWPLVGMTAKMQRTVFVDRQRRHHTSRTVEEIVRRFKSGTSVVLFAEGTSSDGNRVLPFRSALLGAAEEAARQGNDAMAAMQPVAISYIGQHGMPMSRCQRPLVAWYGDLDFLPHIAELIRRGAIDVVVSYGQPIKPDGTISRKDMARRLEDRVRDMMTKALRGPRGVARRPEP